MRAPYRSNARSMPGNGQPIVHGSPYPTPHQRGVTLALMARNQEQNAVSTSNGLFQRPIDRLPRPVERMTVKVEHPIRIEPAGAKAPVPTAI